MARYTVPTVYYQSGIEENTAIQVAYIKSLSWADKTNNNGNFELIIPMDSSLTPFVPMVGGYIRLDPGDTIMQIEKKLQICDTKGNFWYKLGGRPTLKDDATVREAKNENYYFRYVYDGIDSEQYSEVGVDTPVTTIDSCDILQSSTYEDNLGGINEEIIDTVTDEFTWGTIITGQPKVIVNQVTKATMINGEQSVISISDYNALRNRPDTVEMDQGRSSISISSHETFTTDNVPQIIVGEASGTNGRMNRIEYKGSWLKSDVVTDKVLEGYSLLSTINSPPNYTPTGAVVLLGVGIVSVRTVTLKTDQEYLAEMQEYAQQEASITSQPLSDHQPAIINRKVTYVEGGHAGYSFTLKSKGEVQKRYKVDFNLGDTISVNDTRLGVVYTGVVSGSVETIDSNGYNVDIEIGTLGATLEQRVQRVI